MLTRSALCPMESRNNDEIHNANEMQKLAKGIMLMRCAMQAKKTTLMRRTTLAKCAVLLRCTMLADTQFESNSQSESDAHC